MAESVNEDYQRAGFGAHLTFGTRPALVVDVVQAYLQTDSPMYAAAIVAALASLRPAIAFQAAARATVRRRADDIMGR